MRVRDSAAMSFVRHVVLIIAAVCALASGMRTTFEQSGGYVRNAEPLWGGQDAVIQVRGRQFISLQLVYSWTISNEETLSYFEWQMISFEILRMEWKADVPLC